MNNSFDRNIYNPLRDGLTQSLLSNYRQCPTKARIYLNGYTNSNKASRAILFGDVFHFALEIYYTTLSMEALDIAFDIKLENTTIEQGMETARVMKNCYNQVKVMLPQYVNFHRPEDELYNVIEAEQNFVMKLKTDKGWVPFIGKKDRVLVTKENENLWLLETKTKSRYSIPALTQMLKNDLQCKVYSLSLAVDYGVYPKGVIYDVIKAPEEKLTLDMLAKDVAIRPSYWFQRIKMELTKQDIDRSLILLTDEVNDFTNWWFKDPRKDYMYSHSCISQYGSCANITFCSSGKQDLSIFDTRDSLFNETKT